MYRIKLTSRARRELKKLKKRNKEAVELAIEEIKENPFAGKPLERELTGKFSYKTGIFRIVYKILERDKIVLILTAGHRSTVYQH